MVDDNFEFELQEPIFKPFKIGRNDPCPCGSMKKFKKCCGPTGIDVDSIIRDRLKDMVTNTDLVGTPTHEIVRKLAEIGVRSIDQKSFIALAEGERSSCRIYEAWNDELTKRQNFHEDSFLVAAAPIYPVSKALLNLVGGLFTANESFHGRTSSVLRFISVGKDQRDRSKCVGQDAVLVEYKKLDGTFALMHLYGYTLAWLFHEMSLGKKLSAPLTHMIPENLHGSSLSATDGYYLSFLDELQRRVKDRSLKKKAG